MTAAPEPRRPVDTRYVSARSNMVRVDFAQLDHLLNLVGELIIHRTKLQQLGRGWWRPWAGARPAASSWPPSSRWRA